MPGDLQEVEALLRAHGGRSTPARRAVIRALLAADDHHVTAPELLAAIRQDDPGFQESSLYRTLDRLVALEVVHELHLGPGRTVFHLGTHPHHHLVCVRCGGVTHVAPSALASLQARLEREHGLRLDPVRSSMSGICADCWAADGG